MERNPHSAGARMGAPRTILIRIEEDGDRLPIHLFEHDGSDVWLAQPVASGVVPQVDLPDLPPRDGSNAGDPIRALLLEEKEESEHFEAVGEYLHTLLSAGDVGDRWKDLADLGDGVRVLLDVRPQALAKLPWELINSDAHWLGTDVTSPLVRVTSGFPGAGELQALRWPLRVLVVIGSKNEDLVVDAEKEIAHLHDAFRLLSGMVDVEFLHQPSRADVTAKYRAFRPHIFHFIGHGAVANGRGRLVLHKPETGQNVAWSTDMIRADLAGWQPRLAILNACRTASVEQQDAAWQVSDAFDRLGVPAIVAMQADIRGDAAAAFTGSLYRALALGEPLDVAVTHGRLAITNCTDFTRRDFALPSLTVSAPPDTILRVCFGIAEELRQDVGHLLGNWAGFVDRSEERRRLWEDLDPEPDEPAHVNGRRPASAIAIVGRPEVGKSELAQWCVAACALHGGNAAYIDFDRGQRLRFRETLEIIGETLSASPVHGPANTPAFRRWKEEMARLSLAGARGDPPPPQDALESAFSYFGGALKAAARDRPLLLALDHVGWIQDEDWDMVRDWLVEPIARHRLEPVRIIVVLSEDQRDTLLGGGLSDVMAPPIELTTFRPAEFNDVAAEYLRHRFDVAMETLQETLKGYLKLMPVVEPFSWDAVTGLARLAAIAGWARLPPSQAVLR